MTLYDLLLTMTPDTNVKVVDGMRDCKEHKGRASTIRRIEHLQHRSVATAYIKNNVLVILL